jgi:hypothetical protein
MQHVTAQDLRPSLVVLLTIHMVLCQSAVPDISKGHSAFMCRVEQPFLIGQLDSDDAGNVTIPNNVKYWPSHSASRSATLHLSAKPK